MIAIPPKFEGRAYVFPDEAAEVLADIDRSTLYRHVMPHVYSGKIQSMKIGSRRCIRLSSLLEWAEREEARHGT